MAHYEVDPATLRGTAARLRSIATAVESVPGQLGAGSETLGSSRLAGRLDDVCGNWIRRRGTLVAELTTAARAIDVAADAYADTDAGVAKAAAR